MTYKTGNWGSQAKERSKKRLEYFNKYRKKHRQESYKPKRDKNRILLRDLRPRVLEKYGNKCIKCGFDDIRALQIDHINGGGKRELLSMSAGNYYRQVLNDASSKYQLLCANCNWIKKLDKREN